MNPLPLILWSLASPIISTGWAESSCSDWLSPQEIGVLDPALPEASGLASSPHHAAVLWAHNDAGGAPVLYAISEDGGRLSTLTADGASSEDWEDIAAGPCAPQDSCGCLYIGDIGDNDANRVGGAIYRVQEPTTLSGDSQQATATVFPFVYPDGPQDAEAMVVHPRTAQVFIFTKAVPARVYALPTDATAGQISTLIFQQELVLSAAISPLITGADFSPSGGRLALRTESDILILGDGNSDALADILDGAQRRLEAPDVDDAPDAEAIAFSRDGGTLYTTSEGEGAPIWAVACADGSTDSGERLVACGEEEAPACGCGAGTSAVLLVPLVGWMGRRRRR